MARPHNFQDNYGRPNFKLPYRWNDDTPLSIPLAPKNVHVTSPFLIGAIDIRWDTPTSYAEHNGYEVLGVNVYRAYDTPEGDLKSDSNPSGVYEKLNDNPVGALYFRDETREITVDREDPAAGGRIIQGTNASRDWIIKTFHRPIVIPGTNGSIADHPNHVKVEIRITELDEFVTVPAYKVIGETGEIFLIKSKVYNHVTNRLDDPVLPDFDRGGEIRVTYTHINNHIQMDINRRIYYKVTTVMYDDENDALKETPLREAQAVSLYDMEKIDWVWAEAIRRNRWILEQGGERVKVFIRKWSGEKCVCWREDYGISKSDCRFCYGTGYVGGYEGPYDIIIAPPESEKMVQLMDLGLHVSYDFQTWTGPYPLLNDRDFVVRQNNERFSIGRVNPTGSRGAIYQQSFMLSPLDRGDARYSVPIDGGITVPVAWNAYREDRPSDASPVMPQKPGVPDQYRLQGRTVTFENICR